MYQRLKIRAVVDDFLDLMIRCLTHCPSLIQLGHSVQAQNIFFIEDEDTLTNLFTNLLATFIPNLLALWVVLPCVPVSHCRNSRFRPLQPGFFTQITQYFKRTDPTSLPRVPRYVVRFISLCRWTAVSPRSKQKQTFFCINNQKSNL